VMFTDIVSFTPQAEELPEQETADMLNHHFALLGACIEADDGVIDKYIGDCVMAVWGGLSKMDDHADHAVHAALEMARVIREDNVQRAAAGKAPVRLRIGLHSGPVVVGNIGAPGRVNYTVVGDTVNVASRLEQLARRHDAAIVASAETLAGATQSAAFAARDAARFRAVGPVPIEGRVEPVEAVVVKAGDAGMA